MFEKIFDLNTTQITVLKHYMGSLKIFTIIMSIKSKLIYISIVLWIHTKKSVHKVHSQGCSRSCSRTCTIQSVFLVGSQVWEQLTSKKINRHIRHLEGSEIVTKFTLSFQSARNPGSFSDAAFPYKSCFATIISMSKESGLVIAIITNSSQPEGRPEKQECLHLVREHLRNSTSIFHSIIQNEMQQPHS